MMSLGSWKKGQSADATRPSHELACKTGSGRDWDASLATGRESVRRGSDNDRGGLQRLSEHDGSHPHLRAKRRRKRHGAGETWPILAERGSAWPCLAYTPSRSTSSLANNSPPFHLSSSLITPVSCGLGHAVQVICQVQDLPPATSNIHPVVATSAREAQPRHSAHRIGHPMQFVRGTHKTSMSASGTI